MQVLRSNAVTADKTARAPNSQPLLRPLDTAVREGASSSLSSPCPSPVKLSPGASSWPYRQIPQTEAFCRDPLHYAPAQIRYIERFRSTTMWGHEFVIIHAVGTSTKLGGFWVRVDRGVLVTGGLSKVLALLSIDVEASDVIQISFKEGELEGPAGTCERLAHVDFGANNNHTPTIRDLAEVIKAVISITPRYNISKHNCRFMASLIQQAFADNFPGVLDGSAPTWHEKHARRSANAILSNVREIMRSGS